MKKLLLPVILIIPVLLLASCAENQFPGGGELETDQSSIFQVGEVEQCEITSDNVEVKSGLGDRYRTIATLNRGDQVRVLAQARGWYIIRLDNNQLGAIKTDDARPVIPDDEADEEEVPGDQPQDPVQEPQPEQPENGDAENEIDPVDDLTSMERRMVELVNNERRKNDLDPLQTDLQLTKVARIKAQDMVDNNYFSHYSPTYGSPFDMMRKYGIEFIRAGENIAGNSSVERAHNSLMGSSGHRQNILNPQFTHVGIGIKESDRYGYIFVQMFIQK